MKKYRFTILVIGLIVAGIILIAILQASKDPRVNMEPYDNQELVYLGDEEADNELLFLFDYACPWCTIWIDEIFPEIEANYIDTGELKFRTQAMVYVNDASLQLANFDQNVKQHAEDQYHQIFSHIVADANIEQDEQSNWGTETYLDELIESYQLDEAMMKEEPEIDSTHLSDVYTDELGVETVPAIYINGFKVEDPFDIDEIQQLIE
ncbi:thioredoxin domain-containing protein [Amphibacillus sp. Q70]|uniref:thioredoxin domain-containing protein n=1 Tax=Amphibacillus sp. Q70 TaxID=3453416 RepID=UPI003F85FC73